MRGDHGVIIEENIQSQKLKMVIQKNVKVQTLTNYEKKETYLKRSSCHMTDNMMISFINIVIST